MAHDFTKLVNCWLQRPASGEGALGSALVPMDRPTPIEHITAPLKQDTSELGRQRRG